MGFWDDYCIICGGPLYTYNKQKYSWLKHIYGLSHTGKTYKLNRNKNDRFIKTFAIHPYLWHSKKAKDYGVVCHKICYHLLKKDLKLNLKFAHVCRKLRDGIALLKKRYPIIYKYHLQFFEIENCINDGKEWLLLNPYKCDKNRNRILKMWRPLAKQFIKMKIRPSPCESATNFKNDTILIGNNGKKWIVKKNKWVQYKK